MNNICTVKDVIPYIVTQLFMVDMVDFFFHGGRLNSM